MGMNKQLFNELIKEFKFNELFRQMGWDNASGTLPVTIGETEYVLQTIAEKSGFKILLCNTGKIPVYAIRKKLETKIRKLYYEHLIIFIDDNNQNQLWQLAFKQSGKPLKIVETPYNISQYPELLYQRVSGMFFSLDEEDKITIIDVTQRMSANYNLNSEKVTKKFFEQFRKEHATFRDFIKGIEDKVNKDWYASLMLNRLMFCYFIQKKGFLDGNKQYLKDKLLQSQFNKGRDEFYSFYRNFLLVLFHKGLGEPNHDALISDFGKIPYLNGGLFDEHEIEKLYKDKITIEDAAFERVFEFFDNYEWHLDTRITASGKDINPDVIGYIFEKYINDRAEMGAYYTKEDITDYIGKNTIIPWLFDEVQRHYPRLFDQEGELWTKLKASGDEYIYDAVKYGINPDGIWNDLPDNIRAGLDPNQEELVDKRRCWNVSAPSDVALPTEIWREVIERRQRYSEVRSKIEHGELTQINDLITYNLNIRQFAIDVLQETEDPMVIKEFYKALNKITILDPTCGSGAFLFAAMNILEDLYEVCILRMQEFIDESTKGKYPIFEKDIEKVNAICHPNRQYYIYKAIILNNLYGVDIMNEAVEIAKLRLFLKLVACVDVDKNHHNYGLEPLPDIDFNIRCGNTLVGYANKDEIDLHIESDIEAKAFEGIINEKCEIVALAFVRYKEIQLSDSADYQDFKTAKDELNLRLNELTSTLDNMLYKNTSSIQFDKWLISHKPFHWYAEFYEIIHDNGGFDAIIGNPPYVVFSEKSLTYTVQSYYTISCRNLYAYCCERSINILALYGRFGMIVPNSSISADLMAPLQKIITTHKNTWISNYSWRPSKLFDGADMLLAIILLTQSEDNVTRTTRYHKWYNEFRDYLFDNIIYNDITAICCERTIPKFPSEIYFSIIKKMREASQNKYVTGLFLNRETTHVVYYFRAVQYWFKILESEPICLEDGMQKSTGEMKPIFVEDSDIKYVLISILSSSIYFLHYIVWSSCQVVNSRDFQFHFNIKQIPEYIRIRLVELGQELQESYSENSKIKIREYSAKGRSFQMKKQHFYIKLSKHIIDQIDISLGTYYGLSQEELDFVINYDIKYRLSNSLDSEE